MFQNKNAACLLISVLLGVLAIILTLTNDGKIYHDIFTIIYVKINKRNIVY